MDAIDRVFASVPRLGRGWRYIPLSKLPIGTEILVITKPPITMDESDRREINGAPEGDLLYLPGGRYTLTVVLWPTLLLSGGKSFKVCPDSIFLAPSSVFTGNCWQRGQNLRLMTGEITRLEVLGTKYVLTDQDKPDKPRVRPVPRPRLRQWGRTFCDREL